jgi:hypothetical protein
VGGLGWEADHWEGRHVDGYRGLLILQVEFHRLHALTAMIILVFLLAAGPLAARRRRDRFAMTKNSKAGGKAHQHKECLPLYRAHSCQGKTKIVRITLHPLNATR